MKIVFILNNITITRCLKRVNEFIEKGYEVEVYGFERSGEVYAKPEFDITVLGSIHRSVPYFKRLLIIYKALKRLFKKFRGQNVVFYYFFFDVAFTARLICRDTFIYEESDMPYTRIGNSLVRGWFSHIDKTIIRKSLLTVVTSEGFIDYHFGKERPGNIVLVPNRVNPAMLQLPYSSKEHDLDHLSIAFVGGFRYTSVLNFAAVIGESFPQHQFHVHGVVIENGEELDALCEKYSNVHFHGKFRNPDDLPGIYGSLDMVLASYDATSINARYAEPNKMYEAIFFRVPIIVSQSTFLSRKVELLEIGYAINGLDKEEIKRFLTELTKESYDSKIRGLNAISREEAVNLNPALFAYLDEKLK